MDVVRHEAAMARPAKDGAARRAHLEAAAKRGNATARAALEGPPVPEGFGYLYEWAQELHGRSGFSQFGVQPLTYTTIADWARLTGRDVQPHEVQALLGLDAAMMPVTED